MHPSAHSHDTPGAGRRDSHDDPPPPRSQASSLSHRRHSGVSFSSEPASWEAVLRTLQSEQSMLDAAPDYYDPSRGSHHTDKSKHDEEDSRRSRHTRRMPYEDQNDGEEEEDYEYDYNLSEDDGEERNDTATVHRSTQVKTAAACTTPALNYRKLDYIALLPEEPEKEAAAEERSSNQAGHSETSSPPRLHAVLPLHPRQRHAFRPVMAAWPGITSYVDPRDRGQRFVLYGGVTSRTRPVARVSPASPTPHPTPSSSQAPPPLPDATRGAVVAEMQAYSLLSNHWQRVEGRHCVPAGHYGHAMITLTASRAHVTPAEAHTGSPAGMRRLLLMGGIGPGGGGTSLGQTTTAAARLRADLLLHAMLPLPPPPHPASASSLTTTTPPRTDSVGFVSLVFDMTLPSSHRAHTADTTATTTTVKKYTWQAIRPAPPLPLAFHTAVAIGREIIIFGGLTERWVVSGQLLVMHGDRYTVRLIHGTTDENAEDETAPTHSARKGSSGYAEERALPCARYMHSAVMHGHYMIVHGGLDAQNQPLKDTWALDTREGYRWQRLPCRHTRPRAGHCACVVGDAMLVVGGMSESLSDALAPPDRRLTAHPRPRHAADSESEAEEKGEHGDHRAHAVTSASTAAALSVRQLMLCFGDEGDATQRDISRSPSRSRSRASHARSRASSNSISSSRHTPSHERDNESAAVTEKEKDAARRRTRPWRWSSIALPRAHPRRSSPLPTTLLFAAAAPCGDGASFLVAGGLVPRSSLDERATGGSWLQRFAVSQQVLLFRHPTRAASARASRAATHSTTRRRVGVPPAQWGAFVRRQQDFLVKRSAQVSETQRRSDLRAQEAMDPVFYLGEEEIARMLARSEDCCNAFAQDFPISELAAHVPDRAARIAILEECIARSRQLRDVVRSMQGHKKEEGEGGGAAAAATHHGTGRKTEDYSTAKPLRRVVIQDLLDRLTQELTRLRGLNKGLRNSDWPDKARFITATQHMRDSVTALSDTMQRIVGRYVRARLKRLTAKRGAGHAEEATTALLRDDALFAAPRRNVPHEGVTQQGTEKGVRKVRRVHTGRGVGGTGYFASQAEAHVMLTLKQVRELVAATTATERRAVALTHESLHPSSPSAVMSPANENDAPVVHADRSVGGEGGSAPPAVLVPIPPLVAVPTPPPPWSVTPSVQPPPTSHENVPHRSTSRSSSRSSRSSSSSRSSAGEGNRGHASPIVPTLVAPSPTQMGHATTNTLTVVMDQPHPQHTQQQQHPQQGQTGVTHVSTAETAHTSGTGYSAQTHTNASDGHLVHHRETPSEAIHRAAAAVARAAHEFAAPLRVRLLDTAGDTFAPPTTAPAPVPTPLGALPPPIAPVPPVTAPLLVPPPIPHPTEHIMAPPSMAPSPTATTTSTTTATTSATNNTNSNNSTANHNEQGDFPPGIHVPMHASNTRNSTAVTGHDSHAGVPLFLTSLTALAAAREELAAVLRRHRPALVLPKSNSAHATVDATDTNDSLSSSAVWQRGRQLWGQLSALLQSITTRFLAKAGARPAVVRAAAAAAGESLPAWGSGRGAQKSRVPPATATAPTPRRRTSRRPRPHTQHPLPHSTSTHEVQTPSEATPALPNETPLPPPFDPVVASCPLAAPPSAPSPLSRDPPTHAPFTASTVGPVQHTHTRSAVYATRGLSAAPCHTPRPSL